MSISNSDKKKDLTILLDSLCIAKVGDCVFIPDSREANPKLGARLMKDGRASLFLDFYFGFQNVYDDNQDRMTPKKIKRREKIKGLSLIVKPRTPKDRMQNKETFDLAERIQRDRANDLLEPEKRMSLQAKKQDADFHRFFQDYYSNYNKRDKAMIRLAYNRFMDFLNATTEYTCFASQIKGEQMTSDMMEDFCDYLRQRSKGEGAQTIFKRFKKIYKAYAAANGLNPQRPFTNRVGKSISISIDSNVIVKDYLSPEEEKQLIATTYPRQNQNIRNAFIFCLYTGIRFCDVKDLTFGNIDFANSLFRFNQNKTKGHSKSSWVVLPLTDDLLPLLGESPEKRAKDDPIFALPTHDTCNESLLTWCKYAGIEKHITWHCARHSFGTNMAITAAQKGYDIRLVQEMLGHSSLKYTERYTRVADERKRQAMQELGKLMQG